MLLALLVAVCDGDASSRLSAAHAALNWRSDFRGVTRSAAARYSRLLRVSHLPYCPELLWQDDLFGCAVHASKCLDVVPNADVLQASDRPNGKKSRS